MWQYWTVETMGAGLAGVEGKMRWPSGPILGDPTVSLLAGDVVVVEAVPAPVEHCSSALATGHVSLAMPLCLQARACLRRSESLGFRALEGRSSNRVRGAYGKRGPAE